MKKSILQVILVIAMLSTLLVGCGANNSNPTNQQTPPATSQPEQPTPAPEQPQPTTKQVENLDGTMLTVPTKVERIAPLFGPSYEKVVMLGAEDRVVCNGDFHVNSWPWSNIIYKRLDEVTGIEKAHSELNAEDLVKYDIDVAFNWSNPQTTKAMESIGISVIPFASTGKFEDTKNVVNLYAEVLGGSAVEIAERYSAYFDEKVKMITDVTSKIPDAEKPKVYFANQEILWTAGKKSDLPEMIALAGGNCVNKDVDGGSKVEINKEQLAAWNPDYIFVDHAGSSGNEPAEAVISKMLDSSDYSTISAVKNDNIYISPTGVFFWDSGVQKILMLMWMAQTLYPEQFPDLDLDKELKYFYSEFFNYDLTDDEASKILAHLNP